MGGPEIRYISFDTRVDMLTCYAREFVVALGELAKFEREFEYFHKALRRHVEKHPEMFRLKGFNIVAILVYVDKLEDVCVEHGFKSSGDKCERIKERFRSADTIPIDYPEGAALLRDLRERIEDDLKSHLFAHLTPEEADLYSSPTKHWDIAVSRFPRIRFDVEECSKCFALSRYGAAIFHVLLVAEYGVVQIANAVGVAGDRPGWGALERVERILDKPFKDRSPLEQRHSELLKNIVPLSTAIKDSWRHKISHVENKLDWLDSDFDPQIAGEIISATRGFMRRLAQDLP